jgi:hypothetical protein
MKSKTAPSITGFGRRGVIFEEEDVVRLLRVEIKKDGSQAAWRGDSILTALTSTPCYPAEYR